MGLIIRYVSLNIIVQNIVIPKHNIFPGIQTQDSLRVRDLRSFSIFDETTEFIVGDICLPCLISELEEHSYLDSK
jgi:hypothetical protein